MQTRSLAYIEGDENSIDIIFKSSLPGDSLYGQAERYEADELMLTFSYDASELISTWHALRKEHPYISLQQLSTEQKSYREVGLF